MLLDSIHESIKTTRGIGRDSIRDLSNAGPDSLTQVLANLLPDLSSSLFREDR